MMKGIKYYSLIRGKSLAHSAVLLLPLSVFFEPSKGTTIVAVKYGRGKTSGVVVGADTRTSASGYVSNRFAAKLTFVLDKETDVFVSPSSSSSTDTDSADDHMIAATLTIAQEVSTCCVCRSGSAADTQFVADAVRMNLLSRQVSKNKMGTVSEAACLLKNVMISESDLSASLICAGYDHKRASSLIFTISPGGTSMVADYAAQGSGSGYILGYVDENYDRDALTEDQAVEFVTRLVTLAVDRDGSSGGFIRICVINREGKKEMVRILHKQAISRTNDDMKGNGNERFKNHVPLRGFAPPIDSKRSHELSS